MTIAIVLILIGIAFIVGEVIFIPGTTFVGFIGAAFSILGIVKIYVDEGSTAGNIALSISLALFGILFYVMLKFDVWSGMSLKDTMTNKVNENLLNHLSVGDVGVTKSALRPVGKANFGDTEYEVQTLGHYADAGTSIRIIQISGLKIIVETFES
ncbi:NfeD family protein [Cytophaga aurantiaca]|uniref:NfeD family protein n=1 Tax=Cytophaga aurantiaca TaxID=29530 RepID=UPI00037484C6|nr:NfeD family protein [Cytophaga aurantiaca]